MTTVPSPHPRTFIQILLTLFIGVLLAGFVGLAINTFYPAPAPPSVPMYAPLPPDSKSPSVQPTEDPQWKNYDQTRSHYSRNVSLIAIIAAVLILLLSLTLLQETFIIADGLLLGGVFTLFYGIGQAIASSDTKFLFLAVTVGLVVVLTLTYLKFVRPVRK